jgi:hypothetical protein
VFLDVAVWEFIHWKNGTNDRILFRDAQMSSALPLRLLANEEVKVPPSKIAAKAPLP